HYDFILPDVAKHSSTTERRADEAERDVEKMKKVEYMEDRIGEIYEGVISGMNQFGIYVELLNTVEGMVKVTEMPGDYYVYDEEHYEMYGERTKKTYKLGEKVKVEVVHTDKLMRTIDFVFAE
ncbi:MAG: S1 RNA-binding domain-containing protein, partial [Thermoflexaceae bacterium]|nr:S1 RNA-binding domain-containing protein [Thermoflexaceae bacterium]